MQKYRFQCILLLFHFSCNFTFLSTEKTCKALKDPEHGSLKGKNVDFGDSVSYACDNGYVLQHGLERRTCECTGQWSGEEPICQRK